MNIFYWMDGYITTKQRIIHDSCTKQVLMYPILWIAFGWWHNNAFLSSLLAWVLHIVTCTWVLTWPHYSFLLVHWPLLWVVTFIASRVLAIMDLVKPFLSFLLCWSLQDDLPTYILYLRMQVSRALDIVQKGMYYTLYFIEKHSNYTYVLAKYSS